MNRIPEKQEPEGASSPDIIKTEQQISLEQTNGKVEWSSEGAKPRNTKRQQLSKKSLIKKGSKLRNASPAVVSITYEEIGLFPRSFSRVFDRFIKQVFSDVENLVIQEYRFYRYLFLTTLKCLFILLFVPFLVNLVAKQSLVQPLTEYFWNTKQTEIFLNSYQQKRAFAELQDFEEKLYFESLLPTGHSVLDYVPSEPAVAAVLPRSYPWNSGSMERSSLPVRENRKAVPKETTEFYPELRSVNSLLFIADEQQASRKRITPPSLVKKDDSNTEQNTELCRTLQGTQSCMQNQDGVWIKSWTKQRIEQRLQQKTVELAIRYNNQSIEAITNFFADLLGLMALCFLFFALEIQINITKSFLLEVFFGLDDSKKSLLILLVTDLLVGYHSSNLWELFFQFLFNHYGLPENQTGIFLLVATFPVLLDVLFKYLIFRHLNRASPATVATYHAMIE
jgi:hypothetical protein